MSKTTNLKIASRKFTKEEVQFLTTTPFRWIKPDAVSYRINDMSEELQKELLEKKFKELERNDGKKHYTKIFVITA